MDEARKRYLNDATYHTAVDCMVKWLKNGFVTNLELRDAAALACIINEQTSTRVNFGTTNPMPVHSAKE